MVTPVNYGHILRSQSRILLTRSRKESILHNLVMGRLARFYRPRDNVQNIPEPVRVGPSTRSCATDEVGKILKICEQENESLRRKLNRVADQVSALAQQQQAPDGSQCNVLDIISMELDEIIVKLAKAQLDIEPLVEELFTIRRDTNTLFETQSALCRGAQEKVVTNENVSEDGADETAKAEHCSPVNAS